LTPDPHDAIKGPEAEERPEAPADSGPPCAREKLAGEDEKAGAYSRTRRVLFVVELAMGLAYLILLLLTGASASLATRLESLTANPWLLVLFYMTAVGLAYEIVGVPLDFYGGFIVEHRYGQSTQSIGAWAWDEIKGKLVGFVIGMVLLEVVYWLLRGYPQTWWIIAAVMFIAFAVVMANLAPVLLMPIFYKFTPLKDEELKQRLVDLCQNAGTAVRGVYEMDMSRKTRAANAALAGLGNTRRIVLGDTLLNSFDADEIEVVLAHELGHHANWDIWKGLAFQSAISVLAFYAAYRVMELASAALGLRGSADIAGLPLLMLTMAGVSLLFMPTSNAFSRRLERKADRYALDLTGKPKAFISSMTRLGKQNLAEFEPHPVIEFLLFSHPSIGKRISTAQAMIPESLSERESS
jgi:STE24 endopeptidase